MASGRLVIKERLGTLNYPDNDRSALVQAWAYGDQEHQDAYQSLFNAEFDMTSGVDSAILKKVLKEKIDKNISLKRAYLPFTQL